MSKNKSRSWTLGVLLAALSWSAQAGAAAPCQGMDKGETWATAEVRTFEGCASGGTVDELRAVLSAMAYGDVQGHASASSRAKRIFNELERRGAVLASDRRSFLRVLFVNWDFVALGTYSKSAEGKHWIGDQRLPDKLKRLDASSMAASLFTVRADVGELAELELDRASIPPLIVVFSPTCNPCRRAVRAIEADPELLGLFARCSLWVSTVDQTFDLNLYARWNEEHPSLRGYLVRDWERLGLDYPRSTPAFHVIAQGQKAVRIDGWPQEGRKAEILKAMEPFKQRCGT
jgi:hypothetical protein